MPFPGELRQVLDNEDHPDIPVKTSLKMAIDAAEGLEYLHDREVLHQDIKSLNILVTDDYTAKLADFGLSNKLQALP